MPCDPGKLPANPPTSVNVPPFWIVSTPVPVWPTDRFRAVAPGIATSVEFGVTVSTFALVATVGTPAFQLPAVNQSEETAPVQSVWAFVEIVDAMKARWPPAIWTRQICSWPVPVASRPGVFVWTTVDAGRTPYRLQSIGNANN